MLVPGPEAVYFLALQVRNLRCFAEEVTLDLSDGNGRPRQWNVLLGNNGVGKTTLLQCLAVLAPEHVSPQPGVGVDIHGRGYAQRLPRFPELLRAEAARWWSHPPKAHVRAHARATLIGSQSGHQMFHWRVAMTSGPRGTGGNTESMYIDGYGAARHLGRSTLQAEDTADATASLFSAEAGLMDANEWLLRTDYLAKSDPGGPYREHFERVRRTLIDILPDVSDVRIQTPERRLSPARRDIENMVLFKTPFGEVRLHQLSLGYQAMLAWVVDFASRMFERYPDSANPLAEPAVVLVDEIDLHLHPQWQQRIIDYLTRTFPRTQFIVTAHSPLVVQAAEDANIALLRRADDHDGDHVVIDNDPESVYGWRVDQVLTSDLFGLASSRPPRIARLMDERSALVAGGVHTDAQRRRLQEIDEQLDRLPAGESPEIRDALQRISELTALMQSQLQDTK